MQPDGHDRSRRIVRVAAVALVLLGALALGQHRAGAASALDFLKDARKVVDKKGKAKQVLPGKGPLVPGVKSKQIAPALRDRLPKNAIGNIAKGKPGQIKSIPKDALRKNGIARDKLGRPTAERFGKDKGSKGIVGKDKSAAGKLGKTLFEKGKFDKSKLGDLKSAKAKSLVDRSARTRLALAKTHTERGKIRIDHRRQLLAARLRLPPRPLPGQPGFTGVPPPRETRYVPTEMVFHVGPNVSRQSVEAQAKRLGLTVIGAQSSGITGGTLYHFRLAPGRRVPDMVRDLEAARVGVAQPNYVFRITQEPAAAAGRSGAGSPDQYVVSKLRLAEAHQVATGSNVRIAVIDSKVDIRHPDLAGAIEEEFDAVGLPDQPHSHGTGMVGAIAAHTKLLGIAPKAKILAVHAFSTTTRQAPEATTRQIIAGIDWAIGKGARVINMSFAGPYDPMLQLAMKNAYARGVVLIAAAGNLGAKSPPLYPAADPHVIAVTATDESDRLFSGAVRGPHLAVAAPGVDVVVPAPSETYQLTTGTSVAAAHVSGVAALLLERHPDVSAAVILEVLTATARSLSPQGRDDQFGWGLIDPAAALQELDSRIADGKVLTASTKAAPKPADKAATQKTAAPKAPGPRPAAARPAPAAP